MEEPTKVWTTYLPGYPTWWELVSLLVVVAIIMALGQAIKRFWTANNDSVPIPVALVVWVASFALYVSVLGTFYQQYTDDVHKTTIVVWGLLCWIPLVAFSSWTVVNSLAHRTIDRIGPFSAMIEDPSEFSEARKLALRGDIDGAVRCYRTYADNQPAALFEAGRLLKSQDRFAEAAILFEEIAEDYRDEALAWAEAIYNLAKVQSSGLHQGEAAQNNFRRVLERVPSSRFGQLSGQELARIQALGNGYSGAVAAEGVAPEKVEDPFYDTHDVRASTAHPRRKVSVKIDAGDEKHDHPVPPADPFFLARQAFRAEEKRVEDAQKSAKAAKKKTLVRAKPVTAKMPATGKKPAAKKKAVSAVAKAKAKPVARGKK
ncbi:MAG: hypothetical protein HYV27_11755 [Candidatus Hydrogenedentes bacterium]|nr:hypothetical protein [Candidatus Hydrogenedentota bacterium]